MKRTSIDFSSFAFLNVGQYVAVQNYKLYFRDRWSTGLTSRISVYWKWHVVHISWHELGH